jgi:hypothetical protein
VANGPAVVVPPVQREVRRVEVEGPVLVEPPPLDLEHPILVGQRRQNLLNLGRRQHILRVHPVEQRDAL